MHPQYSYRRQFSHPTNDQIKNIIFKIVWSRAGRFDRDWMDRFQADIQTEVLNHFYNENILYKQSLDSPWFIEQVCNCVDEFRSEFSGHPIDFQRRTRAGIRTTARL